MLYDGDQQRYLQLLANGGEEELGIDASDVDSSDVASSNDIASDGEENEDSDEDDRLRSSVPRSPGRGKRGRKEIGALRAVHPTSDSNPLLAEIASKSERRQAAAQRWFNDPLFADVDETLRVDDGAEEGVGEDADEDEAIKDDDAGVPPIKRSRRGAESGRRRKVSAVGEERREEAGAAAALLAAMPKTEKEKRKEKRKKVQGYIYLVNGDPFCVLYCIVWHCAC